MLSLTHFQSGKKRIFDIIEERVAFYSFIEHLLPPRPRNTFWHLKKGKQDFHSKYILVPSECIYYMTFTLCRCLETRNH